MQLDPSESLGPFASAYKATTRAPSPPNKKRPPKPAPQGIQDYIIKDHSYGIQACFDPACSLLDVNGKPVGADAQKALLQCPPYDADYPECIPEKYRELKIDLQDWCVSKPDHYTAFEDCCRSHQQGGVGKTSLKVPQICDALWGIDYNYYLGNLNLSAAGEEERMEAAPRKRFR